MGMPLKEHFRRFCRTFAAQWHNQPIEEYRIHCDASDCLQVERRDIYGEVDFETLPWDKINLVWVYKRDLFSSDQICMQMVTSETEALEIHEDMEG